MRKWIAALIYLCSCSPQRYCQKHGYGITTGDTTIRHDSIIYRDSLVPFEVPSDNSSAQFLIDCQNKNAKLLQMLAYKPGEHLAAPRVEIRDNVLYVNCDATEWQHFVKVRSSELYRDVYKAKTYVKITNVLTGWQWFQIWTGRIVLIMALIYIAWRVFAFYFGRYTQGILDKMIK